MDAVSAELWGKTCRRKKKNTDFWSYHVKNPANFKSDWIKIFVESRASTRWRPFFRENPFSTIFFAELTTPPADDLPMQHCTKIKCLLHCTVVLYSTFVRKKNKTFKNSSLHVCRKREKLVLRHNARLGDKLRSKPRPKITTSQVVSPPVTVEAMACSKTCYTFSR